MPEIDLRRFAEIAGKHGDFMSPDHLHLCFDVLERFCVTSKCRYEITLIDFDHNAECGIVEAHRNVMLMKAEWEDFPEACDVNLSAAIIKAVLSSESGGKES